jgi:hypothetical protein
MANGATRVVVSKVGHVPGLDLRCSERGWMQAATVLLMRQFAIIVLRNVSLFIGIAIMSTTD